jgi:hypothetical protein
MTSGSIPIAWGAQRQSVTVRFVEPDDEALQGCFGRSTVPATAASRRHRRAAPAELDRFIHIGRLTASSMAIDGAETIVGEARCLRRRHRRFRSAGQGGGGGNAHLECRAASFGARRLFGDALRPMTMLRLARNRPVSASPGD